MAVVEFTTGEPRAGKSYCRCGWYLVKEFFDPHGVAPEFLWSNYPIEFDEWTDANGIVRPGLCQVIKDRYGIDADEVRRRVRVFPPAVVESWKPSANRIQSGPWDFFRENDISLERSHIAIDEIHNFAPSDSKGTAWTNWLGEIGHEGTTIEFLTQAPEKVCKAINIHAGVQRRIVRADERRDPMFGVKLSDWWNLRTIVGIPFARSSWCITERRVGQRWETVDEFPFWFDPICYVYNSQSASHFSGSGGAELKQPWEKFSKPFLVFWFLKRNFLRMVFGWLPVRIAAIVCICLVMLNFSGLSAMLTKGLGDKLRGKRDKSVVTPNDEGPAGALPLEGKDSESSARESFGSSEPLEAITRVSLSDGVVIVALDGERAIDNRGRVLSAGSWTGSNGTGLVLYVDTQARCVVFSDGSRAYLRSDFLGVSDSAKPTSSNSADIPERLRPSGARSAGTRPVGFR